MPPNSKRNAISSSGVAASAASSFVRSTPLGPKRNIRTVLNTVGTGYNATALQNTLDTLPLNLQMEGLATCKRKSVRKD